MATDLVLAIFHHFLAFLLASVLATEWALVRPGLGGRNLALLGRLDAAYGGIAGTLIAVGILRVFFGLKGWEYYVYNTMFWAKMASLAAVGLLSMGPTARIVRWRKAATGRPGLCRARHRNRDGPLLYQGADRRLRADPHLRRHHGPRRILLSG